MAPFKNCVLSSQQILYKSLYLNPLSEHSEVSSSFLSETTCLSATSISASSTLSLRSADDQRSRSFDAPSQLCRKENDPPRGRLGLSLLGEGAKLATENRRVHASAIGSARRREPLRPVVGFLIPRKGSKCHTQVDRLQGEAVDAFERDTEDSTPFFPPPTPSVLLHMWDEPECEVAPASSWSTLGNRSLLSRPLPLDVGRCVCYIQRERHSGIHQYILYTDEGHGRHDRKLAVAVRRRPAGRSEFVVYAADVGSSLIAGTELGRVRANWLGSRHSIFDNLDTNKSGHNGAPNLLGVVMFVPTVSSLTGTYRVLRVSLPKHQSTQITPYIHREQIGLAPDWEEHPMNVHMLFSRKPNYNKVTKRYELDFRERVKRSSKIKTSAKNMLLTMNENGKQAILIFGKIGKSKYLLEYRFPLSAHQAFSICLSSLDSKLCCTI